MGLNHLDLAQGSLRSIHLGKSVLRLGGRAGYNLGPCRLHVGFGPQSATKYPGQYVWLKVLVCFESQWVFMQWV